MAIVTENLYRCGADPVIPGGKNWFQQAFFHLIETPCGPSLLTNGAYSSTLQQSGVDYMMTLSGLTVGKDYKVQFVLADNRDNTGYATILSKGGNVTGDSAETLYSYTDGKFAVITASFNADATTAQFQPGQKWGGGGSDATFVSGVHVPAIPEPSTALLGGLGLLALLRRRR